jgi:hypothetical protein
MTQEELRKALLDAAEKLEKSVNAGDSVDEAAKLIEKDAVSTTTSGAFAQREHLDTQIKDITNRRTPFLDRVAKVQANGKTHEWDMITALGSTDTAVAECGTPPENYATITRYSAQIKTYATMVKVCDLAQWAASDYFDLQNTHLEAGMRKILQDVEKKVFYGNHDGSSTNDFTGLYKLIADYASASNTVNADGDPISQDFIDNAIQAIVDAGGMPTHIYMGAKDLRDFAALWSNKVVYNDPNAGMTFGYNVARYMSFAGPVEIVLDPFLTATNSPNGPTGTDVFVVSMPEIALAQTEPMYRLPVYRGTDLAETQTVVWNIVLECKVPQWQAVIKNLG